MHVPAANLIILHRNRVSMTVAPDAELEDKEPFLCVQRSGRVTENPKRVKLKDWEDLIQSESSPFNLDAEQRMMSCAEYSLMHLFWSNDGD